MVVEVSGERFEADLLEDQAPRTCQLVWDLLPIEDRTVHVKWSGNGWRTWGDYPLDVPEGPGLENPAGHLRAGDILYYPAMRKICVAYGDAEWLAPHGKREEVTLFARIPEKDAARLAAVSERTWLEGAQPLRISRSG